MKNTFLLIVALCTMMVLTSCVKDKFEAETPIDATNNPGTQPPEETGTPQMSLTNLTIPAGFDFTTQKEVKIIIHEPNNGVKYSIYAYNEEAVTGDLYTYVNDEGAEETGVEYKADVLNQLLFTGIPFNGVLELNLSVPSYYGKVYIRRKENLKYSSSIQPIGNGLIEFTYVSVNNKNGKTAKAGVTDYLYCVNGSAELFQVDPLTGAYTALSDMPMGSYTAAIDQENKVLYSIGRSNPHPLMKYDIVADSWTIIADLPFGGPRLDYNISEGLLYFAKGSAMYSIDPINGNVLSNWEIQGLDNNGGGDLAFSEDGSLFMCTFSGLYRLELDQEGVYQSVRISADNLPFNPTSMTFDSNGELWLANSSSNSNLIIMDTQTGGWQYNYGVQADNDTSFGRTINDLTTFRVFSETPEEIDTDGDGITDEDDEYPDDAEKAFEVFTPSKYGWGTLAFEDLWPATGDYDFNDVAVNYKVIAVQNAENKVVQVDFNLEVKTNGASFKNGLGIEIENLVPSQIASVTGTVLTQGYINLNANGTEAGQDNAVIIFYDDNYSMLNTPITVSIKLTTPLSTEQLGMAPFNPFMIVNEIREKEVHLPFGHTTTLGDNTFEIEGINKDPDGNYVTDTGLPWAINIVHDFKTPKEKVSINAAYNHFEQWATSGGSNYADWYKDGLGYRNTENLNIQVQ